MVRLVIKNAITPIMTTLQCNLGYIMNYRIHPSREHAHNWPPQPTLLLLAVLLPHYIIHQSNFLCLCEHQRNSIHFGKTIARMWFVWLNIFVLDRIWVFIWYSAKVEHWSDFELTNENLYELCGDHFEYFGGRILFFTGNIINLVPHEYWQNGSGSGLIHSIN